MNASIDVHRHLVVRSFAVAVAIACGSAAPALAQRTDGPYAGVLGGAARDPQQVQGLDLRGEVDGSWDQAVSASTGPITAADAPFRDSGASSGASGSMNYAYAGDSFQFTANGGADARHYTGVNNLLAAYHGSASLSGTLTRRLTFSASGDAASSPFYGFSPFATAATSFGPAIDPFSYAALSQKNESFGGTLGLTANLSKRTTFTVAASVRDWRLLDTNQNDLRTWSGQAMLRHQVTKKLGVHAGYGSGQNLYSFAGVGSYNNSTLDVGVDYGDSLTIGRRGAFSFSTSVQGVKYGSETYYRAGGAATLTHGIGRSWSTWATYNRGIDYQIGFLQPLLNDMATAGISGQAALKLRWSAAVAGTWGAIGFGGDRYHTYSGSTRLDRAIARYLGLYGQYVYYAYDVPAGSTVWTVVPHFSRQVVSAGLTLWVPLVNDARPPKDPEQR